MEEGFISLRPSDAQQGGILDDVDVVALEHSFELWDYGGNIDVPVPALKIKFQTEDGNTVEQFLSAGDQKFFVPSDDGKRLVCVEGSKRRGLNETCNALMYLKSLVDAGFPEEKIGADVSELNGYKVHVNRIDAPKRGGLLKTETKSDRKPTVLIVTRLHYLPWDEAAKVATAPAKTAPKTAAAPKAAAAAPKAAPKTAPAVAAGDAAADAKKAILTVAMEAGGSIARADLTPAIFQFFAKDVAKRKVVMPLILKPEILEASDAGYSYDGETITAE